MSKLIKWVIGLCLVAGIATVGYQLVAPPGEGTSGASRSAGKGFKGGGRGQGKGRAADGVPVLVAAAETADVPVYLEGLGTARALNTVTVQPLVDGRLLSVNFREGQDVRRGDLLAVIDPAIYEAQFKQAQAKKAQDEAQLADARLELDRNSRVGPIATLQKNVDTSRSKVAQLEALVRADQAAMENAATLLGYTRITAPIDGRTGIRLVDEGNVVRASANSALVVITQIRPISVLFNLPQQQLARITAARGASGSGTDLKAEAIAPDGRTVVDTGVLRVIDNQVDQTTGTIRLKAEFPNADLQLWPGQFTSVRLLVDTLRQAVVVPAAAIQQGPNGTFVFVIEDGDLAKVRPVKLAQQDEMRAVIASGLEVGERVATTSFGRLRDDTAVNVTAPAPAAGDAAVTGPGAKREKGKSSDRKDGERKTGEGPGGEGKRGRRRDAEAVKSTTGTAGQ